MKTNPLNFDNKSGFELPKFDNQKFMQMIPKLNDQMLQQIVAQARMMGISENQIQDGINMIMKIR